MSDQSTPRKLTTDEVNYIRENALYKTDNELAHILKTKESVIARHRVKMGLRKNKYLKKSQAKAKQEVTVQDELFGGTPFDMLGDIQKRKYCELKLTQSPRWTQIQKTLNTDESQQFLDSWISYYIQFRGEVTPTEETQMIQLIQYEIMMERALINKREFARTIERLERLMAAELRLSDDQQDKQNIADWESQIVDLRGLQTNSSKEYMALQEKHGKIMENLKATRDQRIKEIEDKSQNFFALVKYVQRRDNQEREARYMGLAKKAMEKELGRFGELHEYMDGGIDRVILNAETTGEINNDE